MLLPHFGGYFLADGGPQQPTFSAALFVGRHGPVFTFVHRPRRRFAAQGGARRRRSAAVRGRRGGRGAMPRVAGWWECRHTQRPRSALRRGHGWPLSGAIALHLSLITRVEWTYLLVFYFPLIISSGMGGKWKQLFIWEIYVLHLAVWFPQLYQCHLGTGIAFYIFRLQQSSFSICCEASNNACLAVFL